MWQLTSNDQNHVIVWGPHKYNIGKPESFQKNVTVNIERQVSAVILSFIERVTFNPLLPWKRTLLPWLQVLQEKKTTKYAQTRWTVCADDRKKNRRALRCRASLTKCLLCTSWKHGCKLCAGIHISDWRPPENMRAASALQAERRNRGWFGFRSL